MTDLPREHIERIHELVVSTNLQLDNIGTHYEDAYGPALLSLATYVVEKIYQSTKTVEDAAAILASAQDVGLQTWIDQAEAERTAVLDD